MFGAGFGAAKAQDVARLRSERRTEDWHAQPSLVQQRTSYCLVGTTLTRHRTLRQSSRPFPPPCRWPRRRHCKARLRLEIQKLRLDIWRAQSTCEASLLLLNGIEGLDAVCCHLALRLLAWDLSPLLCPPRSVEMKFVQPFSGNLDRRRRRDDPSIGAGAAIIDGWSWRRAGAAQLLVLSSGQVSR